MKIKIISKELVKILVKIKEANKEMKKIHETLVAADKERGRMQYKIQRLKDKGASALNKELLKQRPMDEFEYSGQMEPLDITNVEIEIHDLFKDSFSDQEALKNRLRKDKKEKKGIWADPLMFTGHKKK